MNKLLHILGIAILVILLGNLLFWSALSFKVPFLEDLYDNGLVVKLKPYAFAFVHGNYLDWAGFCGEYQYEDGTDHFNQTCIMYSGHTHYTAYNGHLLPTEEFIGDLYRQGYTKIWTTACHTGDHPYMSNYTLDREETEDGISVTYIGKEHYTVWPDYVSRNEIPGKTIPVFIGFGFWRVSVP